MVVPTPMTTEPMTDARAYRRTLLLAAPLAIATPIVIGLMLVASGARLQPLWMGAGALGWIAALALRAPVAIVAARLTGGPERAQPWITAASGPLEEVVRLGLVLLASLTLDRALSIGLGWAAIEVAYAVVNGAAMATLIGRTDAEAEKLRAMIPIPGALEPSALWWGAFERWWASVLHIAFSAIVAARPALVLFNIVAHSATNLVLLRVGKRLTMAQFQLGGAAWATLLALFAAWLWVS